MSTRCINSFQLLQENGQFIPVACGKCPPCKRRRASAWSFRLMQHEKQTISAHFITLTYDTEHVPITPRGFMSLNYRDVQLFYKRLRKAHGVDYPFRIKYYTVGEYGGRSFRPHYHAILFNAKIELIQDAWSKGSVHYGTVTGASIGYTLKYMNKTSKIPLHANDDRIPERALMSKGLGVNYLSDAIVQYHKGDLTNRTCLVIAGGKRVTMPAYYKNKIYSDEEKKELSDILSKLAYEADKAREEAGRLEYGDQWQKVKEEHIKNEYRKMNEDSLKRNKV